MSTPVIIATSAPQHLIIREFYSSRKYLKLLFMSRAKQVPVNTTLNASIVADAGDMSHITETESRQDDAELSLAQNDESVLSAHNGGKFIQFASNIEPFQSPPLGSSLFAGNIDLFQSTPAGSTLFETSTPTLLPGNHSPVPDHLGMLSYSYVIPDFMIFTMTEHPHPVDPEHKTVYRKVVRLIVEAKPLGHVNKRDKQSQSENKEGYDVGFFRMRKQIRMQVQFALSEYTWADLQGLHILLIVGERFRLAKLSIPSGWTPDQELKDNDILQVVLEGDSDDGIPLLVLNKGEWMINSQWRAAWALILAKECAQDSDFQANLQKLA
ncbi:hypothetical protein HYPSUDRAFT_60232 [Hypholoma sublateritium FD-334 SS-4]|uniref:Uncharacterized protein n=1 Tax=Hypholoma sublateritium (strain FD-334 SS-4) TaxID=945553 RepID=A0A0D2NW47_HYPSF|nr:hypothetical protein HYPSUDRAFT_60232 [Hypholoma sublateritium FD-334 SS-4]